MTSPSPSRPLPRKKWLKPTSYSVAADAYVEMWPPMPSDSRLARTTIAMAFQRIRLLMRRSISRLPGSGVSSSGRIVLTYAVTALNGSATPLTRAWWRSVASSRWTRPRSPCWMT